MWKTAQVPLFISKDAHYSIVSPGQHLSLSGGNTVHRTRCLRGARKDDRWCLYEHGTDELHTNPLHILPHSQLSKALPRLS